MKNSAANWKTSKKELAELKKEEKMTLNSLGLPKSPQQTKVCVAMSGGVDSSAAAAMLKKKKATTFLALPWIC